MVGSDHCAWAIEEKRAGADDFSLIPHGIPALETQLPTLWDAGVRGRQGRALAADSLAANELASPWSQITANRLVEAMSTTPARLHGLYPRKGTIALGSDADLVLFDPGRNETISQSRLHSRAG